MPPEGIITPPGDGRVFFLGIRATRCSCGATSGQYHSVIELQVAMELFVCSVCVCMRVARGLGYA
ncbi:hypothetical protein KIN20_032564 [Parelaphostrongylus tenuis]|uniref:Uncharacterized protein n=1 Tax=Parelaphostrongylus tenuis TaxID=148309 RepID=A0AAD5R7D0_PARTN|nr:hypothetical protein KIN20_032564 [Parelaphostrongylus tenuis]